MIFSALKKIFSPAPEKLAAHDAYIKLVEQSRNPVFYEQWGVDDTVDGRFDVIILHIFLLTKQLKNEQPEFVRAVWEVFFSDMDRSLREMGASDTGIGKRIKKMVQAFYGRIAIYEETIGNDAEFAEALRRNLYRGGEVSSEQISAVIDYTKNQLSQ